MTYGGEPTKRSTGFAKGVAKALESVGLLNKGSADSPAAPDPAAGGQTAAVASNALNVTRVAGFAGLVASVGAAALALFGVDKATDKVPVVVAAYASVGLIVAASLVSAAVTISADLRTRGLTATATYPAPPTPAAIIASINSPQPLVLPVDLVRVDAANEDITITLPDAGRYPGSRIVIKRIDASNHVVRVEAQPGQTIDANQSLQLPAQWDSIRLFSTTGGWGLE